MDSEQRAVEAQRYLDSELFTEYRKSMEQDILDQIAECPIRDDEGRRLLQMHYKFIRGIEASLRGFAQVGRFEAQEVPMIRRIARKIAG